MLKFWDKLIKRASMRALDNLADDANYLLVRQNPRFKNLSPEAFLLVMKSLMERRFNKNELIFQEGNPGICMFLIKSGRVEIFSRDKERDQEDTVYTVLDKGALFGEISIVSMSYRTSSARAIEHDTVLLTLSTYDLEQLLEQYPRDGLIVLRGITDSIISHLITTDQALRETQAQVKALKEKLAKYE